MTKIGLMRAMIKTIEGLPRFGVVYTLQTNTEKSSKIKIGLKMIIYWSKLMLVIEVIYGGNWENLWSIYLSLKT